MNPSQAPSQAALASRDPAQTRLNWTLALVAAAFILGPAGSYATGVLVLNRSPSASWQMALSTAQVTFAVVLVALMVVTFFRSWARWLGLPATGPEGDERERKVEGASSHPTFALMSALLAIAWLALDNALCGVILTVGYVVKYSFVIFYNRAM